MNAEQLKNIVEAALLAAGDPLTVNQLLALFEIEPEAPEKADIRAALDQLAQDFEQRGVELREVASGFRIQVRSDYGPWINRLQADKPQRYSRALLETLAIIAYRQPITRGEIEDIRGVSISSSIIKTLQEREWIRVVGHRDVPGKPELLATSRQFLDYFNLRKLSDLPPLAEIKDFDKINPDLFESLEQDPEAGQDAAQPLPEETEAEAAQAVEAADPQAMDAVDGEVEEFAAEDNVVPFTGQS